MNVRYTWYILGASGRLLAPPPYTDEYGDKYALEPYNSEYQAITSLKIFTEVWDSPHREEKFTLVKTYER